MHLIPRRYTFACRCFALFHIAFACTFVSFSQEIYFVRATAGSCVNVRALPSSNAQVLTCLPAGTSVEVIKSVAFWRKISFGQNQQGWIAKKFIVPDTPVLGLSPGVVVLPPDAYLTLHFVDVGQGDAIWIQTWDDGIDGNGIFEGYTILIDGGPYSADDKNALYQKLKQSGHEGANIEALIVTHPHTDHFAGAETMVRHFQIKHYFDPGYAIQQPAYRAFLEKVRQKAEYINLSVDSLTAFSWGAEMKVEVLSGWYGDPDNALGSGNTEINNSSLVLRITYGDHQFLLMGDAEGKDRNDLPEPARYIEKRLLEQQAASLPSTLLKVGHHGSETSSSIPFIRQVNPSVVIIQSGRKSYSGRYLPDASTIARIKSICPGVKVYRTDQDDEASGYRHYEAVDGDDIEVRSNGRGPLQIKTKSGAETVPVHTLTP